MRRALRMPLMRSTRPCNHAPSSAPSSAAHLTVGSLHPASVYQRTVQYFRDYPFVKYSLLVCGVVLGGSLAFESYSKHKKKLLPQVLSLPPHVGHPTLPRPAELGRLREAARQARRGGHGVVYLVGPAGSGKTELACQYGRWFMDQNLNFTHRFRISKPTVLCLDGGSGPQLLNSLREAAMCLGIRELEGGGGDDEMATLAGAVQKKLAANGVPWLIIIDNLTKSATPSFESVFHFGSVEWNWRVGQVVVTSREPPPAGGATVTLDNCLDEKQAMALLQSLSPSTDFSAADSSKLSPLLSSSPLTLALSASTINLYTDSLQSEGGLSALGEFLELLTDRPSGSLDDECLRLYVEAAATQPRVLHTFDLLGSLAPGHPVPANLLDHHLSSSTFYRLPPLQPPPIPTSDSPEELSFWAQLKMVLSFGKKSSSPSPSALLAGFDRLTHLRHSPILAFKKYSSEGFELVQVHSLAAGELSRQLLARTVALLEKAHLQEAEEMFNSTAWFRNYRKFDRERALAQYHSSLPGVGGAGVMTKELFQSSPLTHNHSYSDYLHSISHGHRVTSAIISHMKLLDDGFASSQFCQYIQPHLTHLGHSTVFSESDQVMCRYGLASAASVTDPHLARELYQAVLGQQRRVLGERHPAVARTLTDMAGLLFAQEDVAGARSLLETSLNICHNQPPKSVSCETKLDHGLALASLAVVVSCLGEKRQSRELLEQALALYQTVPESGEVTIYQRRLVAAALTDLSQAYLSLGQIVLAQKYVELAMLALPNVYPEGSLETVRALSVAGAVFALLGDKRESQRVGEEAGKEKTRLEKRQLTFL